MNCQQKFQKKVIQLINAVNKADYKDMALFVSLIALKYEDDADFEKIANQYYDDFKDNVSVCALLCKTIS